MRFTEAMRPARKMLKSILGQPYEVEVEPTNHCNLECPACPTMREEWDGERGYMDVTNFEAMVRELKGKTIKLSFIGRGEPALHEDIDRMVYVANQAGFITTMMSNGTLLDQDMVDRLIEAGLDKIMIGVDGLTPESYEKIRRGGDIEKLFEALDRISDAKRRGADISLQVHVLLNKYNQEELSEFESLRERFLIDRFTYSHIMIHGEYATSAPDKFNRLVEEFVLPEGMRYHVFDGQTFSRCGSHKRAYIRYNGDMQLCCRDAVSHDVLGNVFEEGFFEVWDRNKDTRRRVRDHGYEMCGTCSKALDHNKSNMMG